MYQHLHLCNHRAFVNGRFLFGSYKKEGFIDNSTGEILQVHHKFISISTGIILQKYNSKVEFLYTGDILKHYGSTLKWGVVRYLHEAGKFCLTGPTDWGEEGEIKKKMNLALSYGSSRAEKLGDIFTTPELGRPIMEFLKKNEL